MLETESGISCPRWPIFGTSIETRISGEGTVICGDKINSDQIQWAWTLMELENEVKYRDWIPFYALCLILKNCSGLCKMKLDKRHRTMLNFRRQRRGQGEELRTRKSGICDQSQESGKVQEPAKSVIWEHLLLYLPARGHLTQQQEVCVHCYIEKPTADTLACSPVLTLKNTVAHPDPCQWHCPRLLDAPLIP